MSGYRLVWGEGEGFEIRMLVLHLVGLHKFDRGIKLMLVVQCCKILVFNEVSMEFHVEWGFVLNVLIARLRQGWANQCPATFYSMPHVY